jgi:chromosome segregation ATPase
MNILNKTFPVLENLKLETEPMMIPRAFANALVEASDIAKGLQALRDEFQVLRQQIERAEAREKEALASRDKAVNNLETLNTKRLKVEAEAAEYLKEIDRLRAELTKANDDITTITGLRDLAVDIAQAEKAERTKANDMINENKVLLDRLAERATKAEDKLFKIMDFLTA